MIDYDETNLTFAHSKFHKMLILDIFKISIILNEILK